MTKILLCSDIFGATPHFLKLAQQIGALSTETVAVSPYAVSSHCKVANHKEAVCFTDEQEAYRYFINHVGHDSYQAHCQKILERLVSALTCSEHLYVFAFSAGASAIWQALSKLSEQSTLKDKMKHIHFIGCYPSQIRHHTHLNPLCNAYLIFPKREPHFNLDNTLAELNVLNKPDASNLKLYKTPWLHGFLNPDSVNYNPQASEATKAAFFDVVKLDNTVTATQALSQNIDERFLQISACKNT